MWASTRLPCTRLATPSSVQSSIEVSALQLQAVPGYDLIYVTHGLEYGLEHPSAISFCWGPHGILDFNTIITQYFPSGN